MKDLLNKLREHLEGRIEQRITRSGFVFTGVTLLAGLAAFLSANNLLFLLFSAMLATLLMSGFVNRLSLSGLELAFLLPEHLSARRRSTARLIARNRKRGLPSFSIHLAGSGSSGLAKPIYWPLLPSRTAAEELVEVYFERRGRYRDNGFQIASRFPFGFAERRISVTLRGDALVYPCVDAQPGFEELFYEMSGDLEAQFRGRGYDFYRIRPYENLESARHVDWKATAHTGELQVREFVREQERLVEIFLDLDVGHEYEAWFETAVDCCAFLVFQLSQRGARVRLRSQDFDIAAPEQGDVYTMLRYLALAVRLPGSSPLVPDEENSFRVAFSTRGQDVRDAGWAPARILGPDDLPLRVPAGLPVGPGGQ
jgi:uncharacterized protein (DUF58 family)